MVTRMEYELGQWRDVVAIGMNLDIARKAQNLRLEGVDDYSEKKLPAAAALSRSQSFENAFTQLCGSDSFIYERDGDFMVYKFSEGAKFELAKIVEFHETLQAAFGTSRVPIVADIADHFVGQGRDQFKNFYARFEPQKADALDEDIGKLEGGLKLALEIAPHGANALRRICDALSRRLGHALHDIPGTNRGDKSYEWAEDLQRHAHAYVVISPQTGPGGPGGI